MKLRRILGGLIASIGFWGLAYCAANEHPIWWFVLAGVLILLGAAFVIVQKEGEPGWRWGWPIILAGGEWGSGGVSEKQRGEPEGVNGDGFDGVGFDGGFGGGGFGGGGDG